MTDDPDTDGSNPEASDDGDDAGNGTAVDTDEVGLPSLGGPNSEPASDADSSEDGAGQSDEHDDGNSASTNEETDDLLDAFLEDDPEQSVATRNNDLLGEDNTKPATDPETIEETTADSISNQELEEAAASIWGDSSVDDETIPEDTDGADSNNPALPDSEPEITKQKSETAVTTGPNAGSPAAELSADLAGETTSPGGPPNESASEAVSQEPLTPASPTDPFGQSPSTDPKTNSPSPTPATTEPEEVAPEDDERPLSEARDETYVEPDSRFAVVYLLLKFPLLLIGLVGTLLGVGMVVYLFTSGASVFRTIAIPVILLGIGLGSLRISLYMDRRT